MTLMSVKEVAQYFEDHKIEPCSYGFTLIKAPAIRKRALDEIS